MPAAEKNVTGGFFYKLSECFIETSWGRPSVAARKNNEQTKIQQSLPSSVKTFGFATFPQGKAKRNGQDRSLRQHGDAGGHTGPPLQ